MPKKPTKLDDDNRTIDELFEDFKNEMMPLILKFYKNKDPSTPFPHRLEFNGFLLP